MYRSPGTFMSSYTISSSELRRHVQYLLHFGDKTGRRKNKKGIFENKRPESFFYKSIRLHFFFLTALQTPQHRPSSPIYLLLKWENLNPLQTSQWCRPAPLTAQSGAAAAPSPGHKQKTATTWRVIFFFPHNGAKTCKHSAVCVSINQLLRRRRAAGSTFRSPLPINPTHPRLSPTHPVRVASLCGILPLSGCSIMQIHCLLFTVGVTISWHESRQGPGGPCRVTGREAEEETLQGRRQESESLCTKIKARHREEGTFFVEASNSTLAHFWWHSHKRQMRRGWCVNLEVIGKFGLSTNRATLLFF